MRLRKEALEGFKYANTRHIPKTIVTMPKLLGTLDTSGMGNSSADTKELRAKAASC